MNALDLARWQFGITTVYHFIFVPLTIGLSLLVAMLAIMLYVAVRFDIRYAPGAVVALAHDLIIVVGIFTIIQHEITLPTVAALLTILGYSINDTIIIYDRIRENLDAADDDVAPTP